MKSATCAGRKNRVDQMSSAYVTVRQVQGVIEDDQDHEPDDDLQGLAGSLVAGEVKGQRSGEAKKKERRVQRREIAQIDFGVVRDPGAAEVGLEAGVTGFERAAVKDRLRPREHRRADRGGQGKGRRVTPVSHQDQHERHDAERRQHGSRHDGERQGQASCDRGGERRPQAHQECEHDQRRRRNVAHRRDRVDEDDRAERDKGRRQQRARCSRDLPADEERDQDQQAGKERRNQIHAELTAEQIASRQQDRKA